MKLKSRQETKEMETKLPIINLMPDVSWKPFGLDSNNEFYYYYYYFIIINNDLFADKAHIF